MNINAYNIFESILNIIKGTPYWAWVVLGYLIFVGVKASKQAQVYLPKLFLIPFILMAIKYKMFMSAKCYIWIYVVALLFGASIGYMFAMKEKIKVIKKNKSVAVPGSYQKLVLLIIFFVFQYIFGYLHATNSVVATKYFGLELFIIGLFPGFFLGKTLNYLKRYFCEN